MKAILCQDCGDIIAPLPKPRAIRLCNCERHAVWWEDPKAGQIRVCDMKGHKAKIEELNGAPAGDPRCWILGITNDFLHEPSSPMTAERIQAIIDDHPSSYLFKQQRSCIVRFRPGETGDSAWASVLGLRDPDKLS